MIKKNRIGRILRHFPTLPAGHYVLINLLDHADLKSSFINIAK